LWRLAVCKVKFAIVERPERQSEIDSILNGFIPAHFSFDSTRMNKTVNKNCDLTENELPIEGKDEADLLGFICLCFAWSEKPALS
jgi:hypothetical protein